MEEPLPLEAIPKLSQLYKLETIVPNDDLEPQYKASAVLNTKISVIKQDITTLAIDAIVNAANNSLLGGGGVDGAIHRAAGPKLYDECETLDGCDTGSAKITNGYELPSRKVIHAVGPIYWKEGPRSAELLAGCYHTSLRLAIDNGCRSIAFSALSTGVYGYPSGDASRVALETVRKFLDENHNAQGLDRVIFCNFLQKDEDAYFKHIPYFFPPATAEDHEREADKNDEGATKTEVDSRVSNTNTKSEVVSKIPGAQSLETKTLDAVAEQGAVTSKTISVEDEFVFVNKNDAADIS